MQWTKTLIPTLREVPQDAEIPSHQLMLRAGLIKKLASGLYTWLPLGLRVLKKVENIVREEMDKAGALEILMPILQPRLLWDRSGRWEAMEPIMLKARTHGGQELILGPTHEEVVTDLVSHQVNSYRQLPKNLYQINTKFRDEIRPRFGVMRSREFIMKDAYSFDVDSAAADESYDSMYAAYHRIFSRCGLKVMAVEADTGLMGGKRSHEFMVPAESGEDSIVCCPGCGYSANTEQAELSSFPKVERSGVGELDQVHTPNQRTVEELCSFFNCGPERFIKTLIYKQGEKSVVVLIRGDREVNEIKLSRLLGQEVVLADESDILKVTGAPLGFSGPVGISSVPILADFSVRTIGNGITGANRQDYHLVNVDVDRDCSIDEYHDLSLAQNGDFCPNCASGMELRRGIEVGHVFKLGTKYSKAMGALYRDEEGNEIPCVMGCYGIGVSRTVAAIIEQCHDQDGICWPFPVAPYQVMIVLLGGGDQKLSQLARETHDLLRENGFEVLLDDRDVGAGVKFNDADLIGIPIRITIGKRFLKTGQIELRIRESGQTASCPISDLVDKIKGMMLSLESSSQEVG